MTSHSTSPSIEAVQKVVTIVLILAEVDNNVRIYTSFFTCSSYKDSQTTLYVSPQLANIRAQGISILNTGESTVSGLSGARATLDEVSESLGNGFDAVIIHDIEFSSPKTMMMGQPLPQIFSLILHTQTDCEVCLIWLLLQSTVVLSPHTWSLTDACHQKSLYQYFSYIPKS